MRNPLGQALYWVQGVAEMEKAVPSLLGASTPEGEGLTVFSRGDMGRKVS